MKKQNEKSGGDDAYRQRIEKHVADMAYNAQRLNYDLPIKYNCGGVGWSLRIGSGRYNEFLDNLWDYAARVHAKVIDDCVCIYITDTWIQKNWATTKGNCFLNYSAAVGYVDRVNPELEEYKNPEYMKYIRWVSDMCRQRGKRDVEKYDVALWIMPRLDRDRLDSINEKIGVLRQAGITPYNITYDRLCVAGLQDIAKSVYVGYQAKGASIKRKETIRDAIVEALDRQIEEFGVGSKGYAREQVPVSDKAFNAVWRMYISSGAVGYDYHAPTAEDRQNNGGSFAWVVTKKK